MLVRLVWRGSIASLEGRWAVADRKGERRSQEWGGRNMKSLDEYRAALEPFIAPLQFDGVASYKDGDALVLRCVDDLKVPARCRICIKASPRNDHLQLRRIRLQDFDVKPLLIEFRFPRVKCNEHGIVMAHQTFFLQHSSFSIPFEDSVLQLISDDVAANELARRLHIHPNVLRRMVDRAYRRRRRH